jgi:membrane protease YdiL (CAAX protease family)
MYPLVFVAVAAGIALITGAGHISAEGLSNKLSVNSLIPFLVLVVVISLLSFGEEYGWRGYLLPALTLKQARVVATTVVGIVWGLFHTPIYYQLAAIAGVSPPALTLLNAGFVVTFAFALSFCYYLTESILPCMLLHGIWDVTLPTVFGQGSSGIIEIDGLHLSALLLVMGVVLVPWFITRFNKQNTAVREDSAAATRL